MNPIQLSPLLQPYAGPLQAPNSVTANAGAGLAAGSAGPQQPFQDYLMSALNEVNTMQQSADRTVQQLLTGEDVNPAEVLTAVQKADMSFRLMLQIRNKLVSAFQEVNNIRI